MRSYKPRRSIQVREREDNLPSRGISVGAPPIKGAVAGDINSALQKLRSKGVNVQLPVTSESKNIQQAHFREINGKIVLINPEKTAVIRHVPRTLPAIAPRYVPPVSIVKLPPVARYYDWKQVLKPEVPRVPSLYEEVEEDIIKGRIKLQPFEDVVMRVIDYQTFQDGKGILFYVDHKGISRFYTLQLFGTPSSWKFNDFVMDCAHNKKKFIIGINPDEAAVRAFMDKSLMSQPGFEKQDLNNLEALNTIFGNLLEVGMIDYSREYKINSKPVLTYDRGHEIATEQVNDEYRLYRKEDVENKIFSFPRTFKSYEAMMENYFKAAFSPFDITGKPWQEQRNLQHFESIPNDPDDWFKIWREQINANLLPKSSVLERGFIAPDKAYEIIKFRDWNEDKIKASAKLLDMDIPDDAFNGYMVTTLQYKAGYFIVDRRDSEIKASEAEAKQYVQDLKKWYAAGELFGGPLGSKGKL